MTTTYTTRTDAVEREVVVALGEYVEDFDVNAIADEVLVWHTDYTESGDIWLPGCGFRLREDLLAEAEDGSSETFWSIVATHDGGKRG